MDACFQQERVRIIAASYAGSSVSFTVRNGTNKRASLGEVAVVPKDMVVGDCLVSNAEKGPDGRKFVDIHQNVNVTCTLASRPGADASQKAYGGGFITLDAPGTTLGNMPVPEMMNPPVGAAQSALTSQLRAETEKVAQLQTQLATATAAVKASDELTARVRAAAADAQASAILRLHVVTLGIPRAVPNTPRFHALEDNGVQCVSNWGPAAVAFATSVCGKDNFAWDSVVSVGGGPCGRTVAAFMCKAAIP